MSSPPRYNKEDEEEVPLPAPDTPRPAPNPQLSVETTNDGIEGVLKTQPGPKLDPVDSCMGENMNELIPFCGLGCIVFADYCTFPACIGGRIAGDCCCCELEFDCCRIISLRSHPELKKRPTTGCSCFSGDLNMGDCKTYYAMQANLCCCESRCAIPTDEDRTMPFLCNFLGWTFCYDCEFASACCKSISELKKKEAAGDLGAPNFLAED